MIAQDIARALAQLGDPRFRGVLWRGLGLTVILLVAVSAGFLALIDWLTPASFTLPLIGTVHGLSLAVTWASGLLMLVLSVFLMVPVASAFTGLFLDEVAGAVEDRYYPGLPPARVQGWGEIARDSLGFLVLIVALNLGLLVVYLFSGPFAPVLFWAINGFLLGREYFQMAALRRMTALEALALRRRHGLQVWIAGTLMAVPMSLPLVNLILPVIAAAVFTHMVQRLSGVRPARRSSPAAG